MLKPYLICKGNTEENIMDKKQLAEHLGVDVSWVDKNIHSLPHFNLGKYVRFKQSTIDKWIESITTNPSTRLTLIKKFK